MLLNLADVDLPASTEQVFGRPGPLVMEVGFGDGWLLAHLAKEQPTWNLLGAEVAVGSVSRAFRRLRREGWQGVRLYMGHARFVVRNVIPPRSLHRMYVNFPDPWPKKRHHDRRLLQAPFFELLSTRLEDGGTLLFTTDHAEYFDFALEHAHTTGLFHIAQRPPPPATLQTKYARKWRAQDIPIQHAVFTKVSESDRPFASTVETDDTMHHAILEGPLPALDTFEKLTDHFKGGHVIVLEAYRAIGEDGAIFATRIEEEDLTQEVLVEARPTRKHAGGLLVGIKPFGQPLVTRGTKAAVHVVATWLEAQGMTLVKKLY